MYIHQKADWTQFRWDNEKIAPELEKVRSLQGKLLRQVRCLIPSMKASVMYSALVQDITLSIKFEGKKVSKKLISNALSNKLDEKLEEKLDSSPQADRLVDMMCDAVQNYAVPLTEERLLEWHTAVLPMIKGGKNKAKAGKYRTGDAQIKSGIWGINRIRYKAPKPDHIEGEMRGFLDWINDIPTSADPVLAAPIAFFRFLAIRPFHRGNEIIALAIANMLLARSEKIPWEIHVISDLIYANQKAYRKILVKTLCGDGDITDWLLWYLSCFEKALSCSVTITIFLFSTMSMLMYTEMRDNIPFNDRQLYILGLIFKGEDVELSYPNWAKMTGTSPETAKQDLDNLKAKGLDIDVDEDA